MKILPYDSWTVETSLHVNYLANEMQKYIEPLKWFRGRPKNHMPLQGNVNLQGFSASRIIHYRNSFLPMLYGKFVSSQNGATIHIRMMPNPFALAFLVVWFGTLGLFSLAGVALVLEKDSWGLLCPIGFMGGFMILFTYGGFFLEAGKARELISRILTEIQEKGMSKSAFNNNEETVPPPLPSEAISKKIELRD